MKAGDITQERRSDFRKAILKYGVMEYDRSSIGILREKTVHRVVKEFYAPSEDSKEITVGSYVADICDGTQIIEIQNGNFGKLREKLPAFLQDHTVTVVYPIPHHKMVHWVDPETGEVSEGHKSPVTGNCFRAFRELVRIRKLIGTPGLTIVLPLIDMEEYRLLDGWSRDRKRGSHRFDRMPLELVEEWRFETPRDFLRLLPESLTDPFTAQQLAKSVHCKVPEARQALTVFRDLGIVQNCGKDGRRLLFERKTEMDQNHMKKQAQQQELAFADLHPLTGTVTERFLSYVSFDTQSDEHSGASPSTEKQKALAQVLFNQMQELGLKKVSYDEKHGYVYGHIPSTLPRGHKAEPLGFIAHMDTSPAVSGANIHPRVEKNYKGGDLVLNKKGGIVLSVQDFPELEDHVGEDLIVTDGTTLLGADDKAGIAEIMTMATILMQEGRNIPHGEIAIAFTPDEEIGEGTKYFDKKKFGAKKAYTVDGGALGELEYECFNAAEAEVIIHGRSVHPGSAKGKMLHAGMVAVELQNMLPPFESPMYTEGREGFYYLNIMKATCEMAVLYYSLRDHDAGKLEGRKHELRRIAAFLNDRYGEGTVELKIEDIYRNMIEQIRPHFHLVESARSAIRDVGAEPKEDPIRGGTDGAMLSYEGIPCPNLCTGGYNYHSRFEYASVQEMEKCTQILVNICRLESKL